MSEKIEKTCPICGTKVNRPSQKYCGYECQAQAALRRKREFNNKKDECSETKVKIYRMFLPQNFTPSNVDKTRAEINPHLLVCASCRNYLSAKFEEKMRSK